jgi:hypothetical protein
LSQRRLLLHFAFCCKFTLAVVRAVAQLWVVRPLCDSDFCREESFESFGFAVIELLLVREFVARAGFGRRAGAEPFGLPQLSHQVVLRVYDITVA